ncbi:hypothetical protein M0R19_08020 [Candidatus Pacearchaeota archaeon]|nr:hypothetical protein [Candidatus Pacearchaeota archaeon]
MSIPKLVRVIGPTESHDPNEEPNMEYCGLVGIVVGTCKCLDQHQIVQFKGTNVKAEFPKTSLVEME